MGFDFVCIMLVFYVRLMVFCLRVCVLVCDCVGFALRVIGLVAMLLLVGDVLICLFDGITYLLVVGCLGGWVVMVLDLMLFWFDALRVDGCFVVLNWCLLFCCLLCVCFVYVFEFWCWVVVCIICLDCTGFCFVCVVLVLCFVCFVVAVDCAASCLFGFVVFLFWFDCELLIVL